MKKMYHMYAKSCGTMHAMSCTLLPCKSDYNLINFWYYEYFYFTILSVCVKPKTILWLMQGSIKQWGMKYERIIGVLDKVSYMFYDLQTFRKEAHQILHLLSLIIWNYAMLCMFHVYLIFYQWMSNWLFEHHRTSTTVLGKKMTSTKRHCIM